jgi:hypothetical protein
MRVPRKNKKTHKKTWGVYYKVTYMLYREIGRVASTKGLSIVEKLKPHSELLDVIQFRQAQEKHRK